MSEKQMEQLIIIDEINEELRKKPTPIDTGSKLDKLSDSDFIKAVQKLKRKVEKLDTLEEKLDYLYDLTGTYRVGRRIRIGLGQPDDDYCEFHLDFYGPEELNKRGHWYMNRFLENDYLSEVASYEYRLKKCETIEEMTNLSQEQILKNHERVEQAVAAYEGYRNETLKMEPDFSKLKEWPEVRGYCLGIMMYKMELYIKKAIDILETSTKKAPGKEAGLFAENRPENKQVVIKALKHFNILDPDGCYIKPSSNQDLYPYGIIDALKDLKLVNNLPRTELYKQFQEQVFKIPTQRKNIKLPHLRVAGNAYDCGYQAATSYLNDISHSDV